MLGEQITAGQLTNKGCTVVHIHDMLTTMIFSAGITTRYIDRHPTASMTNNPLVANQSENSTSIKLRTTDNCIKQSV